MGVTIEIGGSLKSTGTTSFTRTVLPFCMPGVQRGEVASTRRTSSVSSRSGDCSAMMFETEPSRSTTNEQTTRPSICCSMALAG